MQTSYRIGPVGVALDGVDAYLARVLARELDPYRGSAAPAEIVDLRLTRSAGSPRVDELQGDAGDGLVTGVADGTINVLVDQGWWSVRREGPVTTLTLGPATPLWPAANHALRPSLQLALHRHAAVAIHASSAFLDGRGIAVAGWSESGKTETVLAMLELGGTFISDKWTIATSDARLATFPSPVFIRRWVIGHLPWLRSSLSRATSARLAAGAAGAALVPVARRIGRAGPGLGFLASTYARAASVADRLRLTPTQLATLAGAPDGPTLEAPLATLVLLTTVRDGPPTVRDGDPRLTAVRLARSAAFERRSWYELLHRAAYAGPDRPFESADRDIATESALLEPLLGRVRVLEVRSPFPVDPRRVADAILRAR